MTLYPKLVKALAYSVAGVLVLIVGAVILDRATVRYADVDEAYTCLTLDAERNELEGSDLPSRESYIKVNAAERRYRSQCIGPVARWWANLTDPIPARPKPSCRRVFMTQLVISELEAELNRTSAIIPSPHPDGLDEAYEAFAATATVTDDLRSRFYFGRTVDLNTQLEAELQRLQEDPAADPMEQYYLLYEKELAQKQLSAWYNAPENGREDLQRLKRELQDQPPGCRGIPFYLYETET